MRKIDFRSVQTEAETCTSFETFCAHVDNKTADSATLWGLNNGSAIIFPIKLYHRVKVII